MEIKDIIFRPKRLNILKAKYRNLINKVQADDEPEINNLLIKKNQKEVNLIVDLMQKFVSLKEVEPELITFDDLFFSVEDQSEP
jgi:hypothetical protein